ncbi:unnamed protein product [Rotaria magnacalcarata]|uniref:Uncharacterized protein n=1 Tax=Rotaria magnacalcarata TaxID=392030 RepID=A0A814H3H5_9BILA|nr:unnamed protein product [Rotaria magnacalcarata]CAF1261094.1 unnamed protein product [Rotaria magnacalcarata]CAF1914945.1 unnamed protein product [Rotaria magnacalcarata]CAF1930286.1 unnamed protein product [Rotaria magnacalcarata]CAF1964273.1 unnamed protein product [Rotaria magnacalcarata]
MQTYHYAFWLLTLSVALTNARSPFRLIGNEDNEEVYDPINSYEYIYAPYGLAAYLNKPTAFETIDDTTPHRLLSFDWRRQSIRKGDPREFMG